MRREHLSPVFPMNVKPVRDGVYIHWFEGGTLLFSLWKDGEWKVNSHRLDVAEVGETRSYTAYDGSIEGWQGLAEDPCH